MNEKPWLSYEDQLDLLKSRGLSVENEEAALQFLSRNNYYRFEGYFRYWQKNPSDGNNNFIEKTSLEDIVTIYEADQKFSTFCLAGLRFIEVLLRTRFAYYYGKITTTLKRDPTIESLFKDLSSKNNLSLKTNIARALMARCEELSISRYLTGPLKEPSSYENIPIWVATEVIPLGILSKLIYTFKSSSFVREIINASHVYIPNFPGQVYALVTLRNQIAHYGRLWNWSPSIKAALPPQIRQSFQEKHGIFSFDSVYQTLAVIQYLINQSNLEDIFPFLSRIDEFLFSHPIFAEGIKSPTKMK